MIIYLDFDIFLFVQFPENFNESSHFVFEKILSLLSENFAILESLENSLLDFNLKLRNVSIDFVVFVVLAIFPTKSFLLVHVFNFT